MKKHILILTLIICFLLCGCSDMHETVENCAVWQNDEKTLINLNGDEYRMLPPTDMDVSGLYYDMVYIVDKDEPPLLAEDVADRASLSYNGIFINYDRNMIYCRSDMYDKVAEKLENKNFLNHLCFSYFDESTGDTLVYNLTDSEVDAIVRTAATEPIAIGEHVDYDSILCLSYCTDDTLMIFNDNSYEILKNDSNLYIVSYPISGSEPYTHIVANGDYPVIESILERYVSTIY